MRDKGDGQTQVDDHQGRVRGGAKQRDGAAIDGRLRDAAIALCWKGRTGCGERRWWKTGGDGRSCSDQRTHEWPLASRPLGVVMLLSSADTRAEVLVHTSDQAGVGGRSGTRQQFTQTGALLICDFIRREGG